MLSFAGRELVVVTSARGANRVYDAGGHRFRRLTADEVQDAEGRRWRIGEDALTCDDPAVSPRPRVAAGPAFWFGWYAQFPETRLIE